MLNGITSYIFGNDQTTDDKKSCHQIALHATDVEDDWIIIDKDYHHDNDACCDMSSSSEELGNSLLDTNLSVTSNTPQCLPNLSPSPISTESNSSRVCTPASTDSNGWYVTPPPCFTAGSPPHAMQTTPLENLLIEHPSMSVYCENLSGKSRGGSVSSGKSSSSSSPDTSLNNKQGESFHTGINKSSRSSAVHRPPRRQSAIASRTGISELAAHIETVRLAQERHQLRQHRMLSRRILERTNKAQLANGAKHHRRKHLMCKIPSGANNNRKC